MSDHVWTALQNAYAERRAMEARNGDAIERKVVALLALPYAAVEARRLAAEASATREREAKPLETVKRVWRGAQSVGRWVYRPSVRPRQADLTLAAKWSGDYGGESYWTAAMESARCAELVALDLYRELYGRAEDLSILQLLSPSDTRWRDADIE